MHVSVNPRSSVILTYFIYKGPVGYVEACFVDVQYPENTSDRDAAMMGVEASKTPNIEKKHSLKICIPVTSIQGELFFFEHVFNSCLPTSTYWSISCWNNLEGERKFKLVCMKIDLFELCTTGVFLSY